MLLKVSFYLCTFVTEHSSSPWQQPLTLQQQSGTRPHNFSASHHYHPVCPQLLERSSTSAFQLQQSVHTSCPQPLVHSPIVHVAASSPTFQIDRLRHSQATNNQPFHANSGLDNPLLYSSPGSYNMYDPRSHILPRMQYPSQFYGASYIPYSPGSVMRHPQPARLSSDQPIFTHQYQPSQPSMSYKVNSAQERGSR